MNKRQKIKFITKVYGPPFGGPCLRLPDSTLNQSVQMAKWYEAHKWAERIKTRYYADLRHSTAVTIEELRNSTILSSL